MLMGKDGVKVADVVTSRFENSRSVFELKWQIIKDKLAQGINGVEWLVLHVEPNERRQHGLTEWIKLLQLYGHVDSAAVMKDALIMDSDCFYKKYEFNWWISISYTLTHLVLLKQRNYDRYFCFLQNLEK
jgi:hypothetical protein